MIDLAPNNPYGLALTSPVLTAAGCFGYGVEYARLVAVERIGAIVTRSTTPYPRRVARPPRLIETPAGLLAAGPWPNPGLDRVVGRYARAWAAWRTPVLLSVEGASPAEYAEVAAALEGVEGIAGLELNLAEQPNQLAAIVRAARAATQLPLLAKLPALDTGLPELARAAADSGADAVVVAAAPRGLATDLRSGERLSGWLCGPAQRPLALRLVAEVAAAVGVPVVGGGGIATADDARQFLAAGAAAVQIGAALLADPGAAVSIADALR
jgi:dihydroorotate dehydrogenase (NAD+) catalytic subunit